jgi:hypothetical protein
MVEEEQSKRCGNMEGSLDPEDVPPSCSIGVGHTASSENADKTANGTSQEGEAVRQSSILQRQDFRRYGLDDSDGAEGGADQDPTTNQHWHGGSFGGDDCTDECDDGRDRGQVLPVNDIAQTSDDG